LLIETARSGAQRLLQQALEVSRPRVDERKAVGADANHEVFASGVLPRFLRRTPSVEGERNCVLVVVGAKFNGEKELLAITNGVRESETSWKELLLDLKDRGMSEDPKLAIADGALGFWKALPQVFPSTRM
jgi:hypothetical protein